MGSGSKAELGDASTEQILILTVARVGIREKESLQNPSRLPPGPTRRPKGSKASSWEPPQRSHPRFPFLAFRSVLGGSPGYPGEPGGDPAPGAGGTDIPLASGGATRGMPRFQEVPRGAEHAPRGLEYFGRPMPGGHGAAPTLRGRSRWNFLPGISRCPLGAWPRDGKPLLECHLWVGKQRGRAGGIRRDGICRKQGPGKNPAEDLRQSALKCK